MQQKSELFYSKRPSNKKRAKFQVHMCGVYAEL
jgi:hypothetical protein